MTTSMKGSLLMSLITLGAAGMLLNGCGDSKSEDRSALPPDENEQSISVTVEELRLKPFTETFTLTGYVKSIDDVLISTEEGGTLREWKVRRGAAVNAGDVIGEMKDDVLRPLYEAAKAQYEIAELTYQKQRKVLEEQGISEIQVRTTQYTRDAAKAQMELAANRLERTKIKSPINGVLDTRLIEEGELAPPGSPVARVVNLDRTKVIVDVPESQAASVRTGTPAAISVSAYPNDLFQGRVSFVSSAVSAENRTVQLEVLVSNAQRKLKPDMIARVRLTSSGSQNALLVDEGLIHRIDQNTSVVYVEQNGMAERRNIVMGGRSNGSIQITGGLEEGDRLIVSGAEKMYDGLKVTVMSTVSGGDSK